MLKASYFILICSVIEQLHSRVIPSDKNIFDSILSEFEKLGIGGNYGCEIDINKDLADPQPLFMTHHLDGSKRDYLEPVNSTKGLIYLNSSQAIELHCSHGFKNYVNVNSLKANCLDRKTFVINGEKRALNEIACNRNTFHTTKTVGKCKNDGHLIEIGYEIPSLTRDVNNNFDKSFHKLITICRNNLTDTTFWSHNILSKANSMNQNGVPRPSFLMGRDHFTSKNVNRLYSKINQIQVLTKMLGSEDVANILINERQSLNRGHLTPKADMIMANQQRSTHYFINVQPQFSTFNGGNWAKIEESVRRMVTERDLTVDVYTGTYGIVSYKDMNGQKKDFYLNYDDNGNGLIPVPKIFYKIVIDRKSLNGIALIGVNNPYVTLNDIRRDYIFCTDISYKIKWVHNIQERIPDGYYYACDVNELTKVVDTLPKLNVTGLLI